MSDAIQPSHEIQANRIIVDPRSLWRRIWDSLEKPWLPFAWAVFAVLLIAIWPGLSIPALLVQCILWMAVSGKPDTLPIHLPIEAQKTDLNDPRPGENSGFYKARGSFYIGKLRKSGAEVWVSFKALTQHFLIFGTTGSGKTESFVSYIVNYLAVGSAVSFQDAKAAPKAMIQIATICRIFGRDDDFRVTNYITGMTSARRDPAERISNDAAVFARGSAESNTQLLVSLMPPSGGDNKIFAERAVALIAAVMPALTELRDLGKLQIDPSTIRHYMSFQAFVELYRNNYISGRSREALKAYLQSLPGFDEKKSVSDQAEEVTRQFGFAQAYFTRSLSSLSDTYGHIYLVGQGEIDYQDAVLNGRILLTLLPSMEKSGEELSSLGKIVLTALRNGMVVGLGTVFEGSADDIVHSLPTNSEIPYGICNDENAYMLVEGQEIINAQARGLGFGVMTGTQDAPGMLLNHEKTTKQILANSAFKQIGYLDDKDTTDLAVEFSGEANVMVRGRYEMDGDLGNFYASKDVSVEKRPRLTSTAIKRLGLGHIYLMYQGKIHETQVFNHGIEDKTEAECPDPTKRYLSYWYSVRMAKVQVPSEEVIKRLYALSPRPEWRDLMAMINDNARAILREMQTYFSSMIIINNIARQFGEGSPLFNEAAASLNISAMQIGAEANASVAGHGDEEVTGILSVVSEMAPKSIEDAALVIREIVHSHMEEERGLIRLADEAGLDTIAGMDDLLVDEQFDPTAFAETEGDEEEGGSGGTGGAGGMQQAFQEADTLIAEYLGFEDGADGFPDDLFEPAPLPEARSPQATKQPAVVPEQKASVFASAVESNLHRMPWMASVVEYNSLHASLVEVESAFGAREPEFAVSEGLNALAVNLDYPETLIDTRAMNEGVNELISSLLQRHSS